MKFYLLYLAMISLFLWILDFNVKAIMFFLGFGTYMVGQKVSDFIRSVYDLSFDINLEEQGLRQEIEQQLFSVNRV